MLESDRQEVSKKIARVAAFIGNHTIFQAQARLVAEELGPIYIEQLASFLHKPPAQPREIAGGRLGQWLATCQAAVFEIFYYLREEALPKLRQIAYDDYDWIQINALEILCRFAIENIEREQIDEELSRELGQFRYEAVMSVRSYLVQFIPLAPRLRAAYQELIQEYIEEPNPVDALDLIEPFLYFNPQYGRTYEGFLRKLMYGEGLANRSPLLDGYVVSLKPDGTQIVHGTPLPVDYHAIRATQVLQRLFPEDEAVMEQIRYWSAEHPDEAVRAQLKGQMKGSDR